MSQMLQSMCRKCKFWTKAPELSFVSSGCKQHEKHAVTRYTGMSTIVRRKVMYEWLAQYHLYRNITQTTTKCR